MPTTIMGKEATGGAWAELDAGTYNATITAFEDAEPSKFSPDKARWKFTFTLADHTDEEGAPLTLFHWINQVLSAKSNLATLVQAAGLSWAPGQNFTVEELIGKPIRLMVNVRDTENGLRPFIADVIAAAKRGGTAPVQAETKAEECSLPKCHEPVNKYDNDGNPFCAKHEGLAG